MGITTAVSFLRTTGLVVLVPVVGRQSGIFGVLSAGGVA